MRNMIPLARAGHSASLKMDVEGEECMYIFGGNAIKNVRLNDLWKLCLQTY